MTTKRIRKIQGITQVQQERLQNNFETLSYAIRAGHCDETVQRHTRAIRRQMERLGITEIELED